MEKVKQLSNVVVAERLGYWNRNEKDYEAKSLSSFSG